MSRTKKKESRIAVLEPSLSKPADEELPLRQAIFVYQQGIPRAGYRAGSVITTHTVRADGTLGSPKLLDPVEFARSIEDLAAERSVEKLDYLPEHILAQGRRTLVWWRPAQATPLWFKTQEPRLTALNGKPVPLPALVFRAVDGGLDVWALAESQRPTPDTPLMYAPFMNIMGDGASVCLGTARSKDLTRAAKGASTTEQWEHLFFESNFTHSPPRLNYAQGQDYAAFLEQTIQAGSFPSEALVATRSTLRDALQT